VEKVKKKLMKVIPAFSRNYNQGYSKKSLSLPQSNLSNNALKSDVAFGSSFKMGLSKWVNKVAHGNFFIEFLVVDAVSMIAPRVYIGLKRDKDKTGNYNYKAGAEEAGRECFTGPSIFLIPMAIMNIFKHFSPASHIPHDTLNSFTSVMNEITQKAKPEVLKDKAKLNKALAEKLFDKSFSEFSIDDKDKFKSQFVELLTTEKSTDKNKGFRELVAKINNSNKKCAPADSNAMHLEELKLSAGDLYNDFHRYSKDVIDKLSKLNFVTVSSEEMKTKTKEFLEKIRKIRSTTKTITAVTGFLAVGMFLLYLPKLVQVDKTSPAMESAKRAQKEGELEAGGANENK